jgi:hypothetical protein
MGGVGMSNTRDATLVDAAEKLSRLTGEDFHGYRSEVWGVLSLVYAAGLAARTPGPATLAWSSEPPKLPGLYTRRLGEAYATHRLDSENVAYASHWYPADAWFGPIPEPGEVE